MDFKFPVYSLECPTLVDLIKAGDIIYVYDGSKTSRTKNTEEQNERLKEQLDQKRIKRKNNIRTKNYNKITEGNGKGRIHQYL